MTCSRTRRCLPAGCAADAARHTPQLHEVVRVRQSADKRDQKDLFDLLGRAGAAASTHDGAINNGGLPTSIKVPDFAESAILSKTSSFRDSSGDHIQFYPMEIMTGGRLCRVLQQRLQAG